MNSASLIAVYLPAFEKRQMVNQIYLQPFNVCWPCRFATLHFKTPFSCCFLSNTFTDFTKCCESLQMPNAFPPRWKFLCRVKILIRLFNQIREIFLPAVSCQPEPLPKIFCFPFHLWLEQSLTMFLFMFRGHCSCSIHLFVQLHQHFSCEYYVHVHC